MALAVTSGIGKEQETLGCTVINVQQFDDWVCKVYKRRRRFLLESMLL